MHSLDREHSRRAELLKTHILRVFQDLDTGWNWLKEPNPALGWARPYDLLSTDEGFQQVDDILTRIEYGVYS